MTPIVLRAALGVGAGLIFAVGAYRVRALNGSGAVAAGFFAGSLVFWGDLGWMAPGLAFFVLSSAFSRVGRARKLGLSDKGPRRDAVQVLANGGVAWMMLLMHAADPQPEWYAAYLGALAAATADTWATELGVLGSSSPRLITTLRPVPAGTSGAVSGVGTAAALLGAVVIWASAAPWAVGRLGAAMGVAVVGGGVAASLLDSLLGATLEGRRPWLDNDAVNLVATTVGAALSWTCFRLAVFAS